MGFCFEIEWLLQAPHLPDESMLLSIGVTVEREQCYLNVFHPDFVLYWFGWIPQAQSLKIKKNAYPRRPYDP